MKKIGQRILLAFQRFMYGRYGTDKLNTLLIGIGFALCFVNLFVGNDIARLVITMLTYGLLILAMYRCFSRNTYKRYRENAKYLQLLDRIKDKNHRYFTCPKCKQTVRVPKGKGKIAITCPKCKEKFTKKT